MLIVARCSAIPTTGHFQRHVQQCLRGDFLERFGGPLPLSLKNRQLLAMADRAKLRVPSDAGAVALWAARHTHVFVHKTHTRSRTPRRIMLADSIALLASILEAHAIAFILLSLSPHNRYPTLITTLLADPRTRAAVLEVRELRDKGHGDSVLHVAARRPHCGATVAGLLAAGMPAHAANGKGWTALHEASFRGRVGIVASLLAHLARPDHAAAAAKAAREAARSDVVSQAQPSAIAAAKSALGTARRVEYNPCAAAVPDSGDTPLTLAASKGHAAVVELLLAAVPDRIRKHLAGYRKGGGGEGEGGEGAGAGGALSPGGGGGDTAADGDSAGMTVAEAAQAAGVENVTFSDVAKGEKEETALHRACRNGDAEVVRLLIRVGGANVHARSNAGRTPLLIAADFGFAPVVQHLVDAGADVHAATFQKKTPLYCAAERNHPEVAKILLAHGAKSDMLRETTFGTTPMFIASRNQSRGVEALMINAARKKGKKRKVGTKGSGRDLLRGDSELLFSSDYLDHQYKRIGM